MRIKVKVLGVDEVLSGLDEVNPALLAGAETGMRSGLERVVTHARALCPTDTGELKGSLRASVEASAEGVSGTVGTNKEYAVYVEMGTGDRGRANHVGIDPRSRPQYTAGWPGQAAQPYLYPAYKTGLPGIIDGISRAIAAKLGGG